MITFLKLGGSLITDKNTAHTARKEIIRQMADEIYEAWTQNQEPLLIGHGSGSFGHIPAKRYGTRDGVYSEEEWHGFAEVHAEATALNRIVTDTLREAGLPILSIVPMDNIRTEKRNVVSWDTMPIKRCFENHMIPLVFGDTVFDNELGGTILSTEDLFVHLCSVLGESPRILLAGLEDGVWQDFPQNNQLITEISAGDSVDAEYIKGSVSTDVTGGMFEKVRLMKALVRSNLAASALIFSGTVPGNIQKALEGEKIGTAIIK